MPIGRRPAFPAHRDGGLIERAGRSVNALQVTLFYQGFSHFPVFSERKKASRIFMFWMASSTPQAGAFFFRMARPKASIRP